VEGLNNLGDNLMLPRSKFDIERARNLSNISLPELEPHLEELFTWLQDGNWPVARPVADFLTSVGIVAVPHVRKILQGNDDIWKMSVLSSVVDTDDLAIANALRGVIERIAKNPTQGEILEGTQEIAEEILEKLSS
jgi:hypothetical protein